MFYVGIDIAKNTHWASIMSSDGEIVKEPFSFSNDNSGFQKFISNLESLDKTKILIGLESTAHYGENIISYLFNLNYKIGLISLSLQIKHAIFQIELYNKQIAEIESLYKSILDEMDSPILTIPGMSYNQAAVIVGSIGDINRFTHSCQLLAYAGLDPSVVQSGNFQARSTKMSKLGSGLLRYSLVYAAHNVVLNNKTFKEYYELKRSQGKSHYCALGHVSHKLVRIIFKMLKDNVAFNLD